MQGYVYNAIDTRSRDAKHKREANLHPECDKPVVDKCGERCDNWGYTEEDNRPDIASVTH